MSSEELRLDLELFINKGLAKGLRGWPPKGQECRVEGNSGNQLGHWRRWGSNRFGEVAATGVLEGIGAF